MKKLTERQKLVLREMVNFTCEGCDYHEDKVGILTPHRMNQELGYIPRNIKMLGSKCECHEEFSAAQRIAVGTQK